MNVFFYQLCLLFCLMASSSMLFAEVTSQEEAGGIPVLTAEQRLSMGIVISPVSSRQLAMEIVAPGEVRANAYRSSQVTSRISAQIIKRYARMGDPVQSGDKLLTLTSVSMAEAQSQLLITDLEWQRVKNLGRTIVSERRYVETQISRQQAIAKALAFGMTDAQVQLLLNEGDVSKAVGRFDLVSSQDGTVISDSFVLGQVVEPGVLLMEISDESVLWVETRISPDQVTYVNTATQARIQIDADTDVIGQVIQLHRRIDETTRTLPVRLEVKNEHGLLRPGQFVKVSLQTSIRGEAIAIPKTAVVLLQGESVVFLSEGSELYPKLVDVGDIRGDWIEIKSGLEEGDRIATKGMFLLKSLLLKSQIGDAD